MAFDWLHTSDWHYGASRRLKGYVERQELASEKVFKIAEKKTSSGVVLVSADVFDREYVLPKERDALLSTLLKADQDGFTVIVTDGNHDRLSKTHSNLTVLKVLSKFGAFKRLKVAVIQPEKFTIQGQDILAIPWQNWTEKQYNKHVLTLIKELKCKKPIVMTHEQFRGCPDDSGWQTDEGPLPNNKLLEQVTYVAAGHVHRMQRIAPKSFYCGAPLQKTFGCIAGNKGVLVVDADHPDEPEHVLVKGIKPMLTLRKIPKEWPDAYIRLKLPKGTETGKLPDDVIYNLYESDDVEDLPFRKVDLSNPLEGLRELLIKAGMAKRLLPRALTTAQDIYKQSGVLH